ncbi:PLDc N-terminal domain-containing protein [Mucilaginibacter sp. UR6-11]|uniref:PLDc N-terminal domain-containing protein n=1 Tax=Mucilaginibacter sp. UR6-11 TaxID=1435644 RepID=UPI00351CFCC7
MLTSAISGTFGLIFLIAWALLVIFALISIFRNANVNRDNKFLWFIIVVIVPIIGPLVYWFWHSVRRPE